MKIVYLTYQFSDIQNIYIPTYKIYIPRYELFSLPGIIRNECKVEANKTDKSCATVSSIAVINHIWNVNDVTASVSSLLLILTNLSYCHCDCCWTDIFNWPLLYIRYSHFTRKRKLRSTGQSSSVNASLSISYSIGCC